MERIALFISSLTVSEAKVFRAEHSGDAVESDENNHDTQIASALAELDAKRLEVFVTSGERAVVTYVRGVGVAEVAAGCVDVILRPGGASLAGGW